MTEVTSERRVFIRHCRAAVICKKGQQAFFAKHHLDWRDYLKNGIPGSKLQEIGDPIALRALAEAEKESADGR